MGSPRINAEPALPEHPGQVGPIENLEHEAEAVLEFTLPLLDHGRGHGDHDGLDLLAEEQLASDQARFDRLTQAGVGGDEEG